MCASVRTACVREHLLGPAWVRKRRLRVWEECVRASCSSSRLALPCAWMCILYVCGGGGMVVGCWAACVFVCSAWYVWFVGVCVGAFVCGQVSVPRIASELVEGYMSMAAPGVTLLSRVSSSLPAQVMLDQLRVKQILSNGLTNALKHTVTGTVVLQVCVQLCVLLCMWCVLLCVCACVWVYVCVCVCGGGGRRCICVCAAVFGPWLSPRLIDAVGCLFRFLCFSLLCCCQLLSCRRYR